MTPYAQAKVLRVIESKQIQRLGGKASIPVNVRILAATNHDLPKLISGQRFLKDLYFGLNVAHIPLPSLRQRREDIVDLLNYYVGFLITKPARAWRVSRPAPFCGLRNTIGRAISANYRSLVESIFIDPPYPLIDECHLPLAGSSENRTEVDDRKRLLGALRVSSWNKSKAAARLHWSRMKIYRKLAHYHIDEQTEPTLIKNHFENVAINCKRTETHSAM